MRHIDLYQHVGNSRWGHDVLLAVKTVVDDADVRLLNSYTWRLTSAGYAYARVEGKQVLLHRLLMGLRPGDARQVDHLNHNRLDNQRSNLEVVTQLENIRNVGEYPRKYSSYPGVSASRNRWRAYIGSRHLGVFTSEEEAAKVAKAARIERGW